MNTNFKSTLMVLISSCGVAALTTNMVEAVDDNVKQRLFRSSKDNWTITKQDLESEGSTFSRVTNGGNTIEFAKTNNSVGNLAPLTGLLSVTLESTNRLHNSIMLHD